MKIHKKLINKFAKLINKWKSQGASEKENTFSEIINVFDRFSKNDFSSNALAKVFETIPKSLYQLLSRYDLNDYMVGKLLLKVANRNFLNINDIFKLINQPFTTQTLVSNPDEYFEALSIAINKSKFKFPKEAGPIASYSFCSCHSCMDVDKRDTPKEVLIDRLKAICGKEQNLTNEESVIQALNNSTFFINDISKYISFIKPENLAPFINDISFLKMDTEYFAQVVNACKDNQYLPTYIANHLSSNYEAVSCAAMAPFQKLNLEINYALLCRDANISEDMLSYLYNIDKLDYYYLAFNDKCKHISIDLLQDNEAYIKGFLRGCAISRDDDGKDKIWWTNLMSKTEINIFN
jgi:hypothetical protein